MTCALTYSVFNAQGFTYVLTCTLTYSVFNAQGFTYVLTCTLTYSVFNAQGFTYVLTCTLTYSVFNAQGFTYVLTYAFLHLFTLNQNESSSRQQFAASEIFQSIKHVHFIIKNNDIQQQPYRFNVANMRAVISVAQHYSLYSTCIKFVTAVFIDSLECFSGGL